MYDLYDKNARYVLGFHGCDESVATKLISGDSGVFIKSENDYDWLGHGLYFWENDPMRAESFILEKQSREPSKIKNPTVIGAVLDLGYCFNLVETKYIKLLKEAYHSFLEYCNKMDIPIPENKNAGKKDNDHILRYLDCAVVQFLLGLVEKDESLTNFDSVRAMFVEGGVAYPNAGFHEKTHVQIAIRNPDMIKGYFRPIR